jgi:hypothetical protein
VTWRIEEPGPCWPHPGRAEAGQRLRAADIARTAYVRGLYRCDPADPAMYHLMIDSTAKPLDTVTELIVITARAPRLRFLALWISRSGPAPGRA